MIRLIFGQLEEIMRTYFVRATPIIMIFVLLLSACASDPTADESDPATVDTGPESAERLPEPTQEEPAPAATYEACNMLTQAEIEAVAFRDYPAGEGQSGTDAPFTLGDAVSCSWEVGDPDAQFHERLSLYIIALNGKDPLAAYEENAGRLARSEEITGLGDAAAYEDRSGFMVVLDGDFLFLLRADLLNADGLLDPLTDLARLVISRK
jgi:hypothetical protein